MAGSISLSLSQQFDTLGKPLSGGLLYFIMAGTTSTPQNAFKDTALTLPHPNPIILDAAGRVPAFYLADGQIKIRLTDKNGVQQIVQDNLLVIGPSSGGGGGGGSVDAATIFSTGDLKCAYGTSVLTGWVRSNGRTIGSATSGATERANSDCQALFVYLWGTDANLAVSGGRGASGLADFSANKTIVLPDFRGRVLAGLDDMGNSAAGRLTATYFGSAATTLGVANGSESQTLTIAQTPSHNHGVNDPGHTHSTSSPLWMGGAGSSSQGGSTFAMNATSLNGSFTGVSIQNSGGGGAHPNVQPTILATIYLKI